MKNDLKKRLQLKRFIEIKIIEKKFLNTFTYLDRS
jgi:hypothetical protein